MPVFDVNELLAGKFRPIMQFGTWIFTFAVELEVGGGLGKDPRLTNLMLFAPVGKCLACIALR